MFKAEISGCLPADFSIVILIKEAVGTQSINRRKDEFHGMSRELLARALCP